MSAAGKASSSIVDWRHAHRNVEAALRLLAVPGAEQTNLTQAAAHVRSAWQHIVLATGGVVPAADGSSTAAPRAAETRDAAAKAEAPATPSESEPGPEPGPDAEPEPEPEPDASTDGEDATPSVRSFARQWLRVHYGDDAHVEGACLSWLFPEAAAAAGVAPMPAELRTHALWMRYRILDHVARREGMGRQAVAVVAVGFVGMLSAVLIGELAGPDLPWKGEYFDNEELKGKAKVEYTDKVEFDFGRGAPLPSIPKDEFSVRWSTCLQVDETAEFAFELTSDDGSRLFVDGVQVIDNWGAHGKRARDGSIELEDGPHLMEVEYFDRRYGGRVTFKYDAEGGKDFVRVPPEVLKPPEDGDDPCG